MSRLPLESNSDIKSSPSHYYQERIVNIREIVKINGNTIDLNNNDEDLNKSLTNPNNSNNNCTNCSNQNNVKYCDQNNNTNENDRNNLNYSNSNQNNSIIDDDNNKDNYNKSINNIDDLMKKLISIKNLYHTDNNNNNENCENYENKNNDKNSKIHCKSNQNVDPSLEKKFHAEEVNQLAENPEMLSNLNSKCDATNRLHLDVNSANNNAYVKPITKNKAVSCQDIHSEYTKKRFAHIQSKVGKYIAEYRKSENQRKIDKHLRYQSLPETLVVRSEEMNSNNNNDKDNNNNNNNKAESNIEKESSIYVNKEFYEQLIGFKEQNEVLQSRLEQRSLENFRLKQNLDTLRLELTNCNDELKATKREQRYCRMRRGDIYLTSNSFANSPSAFEETRVLQQHTKNTQTDFIFPWKLLEGNDKSNKIECQYKFDHNTNPYQAIYECGCLITYAGGISRAFGVVGDTPGELLNSTTKDEENGDLALQRLWAHRHHHNFHEFFATNNKRLEQIRLDSEAIPGDRQQVPSDKNNNYNKSDECGGGVEMKRSEAIEVEANNESLASTSSEAECFEMVEIESGDRKKYRKTRRNKVELDVIEEDHGCTDSTAPNNVENSVNTKSNTRDRNNTKNTNSRRRLKLRNRIWKAFSSCPIFRRSRARSRANFDVCSFDQMNPDPSLEDSGNILTNNINNTSSDSNKSLANNTSNNNTFQSNDNSKCQLLDSHNPLL